MSVVFRCQFCNTAMQADLTAVGKQCVCVSCGRKTDIVDTSTRPVSANASSKQIDPQVKKQILSIGCPRCNQNLDYARALIGTKGLCRNCHELFILPAAGQKAVVLKRAENSIAFECPTCVQLFEGLKEQIGRKGKCTNCQTVFTIEAIEPKRDIQLPQTQHVVNNPATTPPSSLSTSSLPPISKPTITSPVVSTSRPNTIPADAAPLVRRPSIPTALQAEILDEPPPVEEIVTGTSFAISKRQSAASSFPAIDEALDSQYAATSHSNSPYTTPHSAAYPHKNHVTLGAVFEKTFDSLFPTIFYMYLPFLAWAVFAGAAFGICFGITRAVSMGGKPSDEVLLVVALVNLTILVFGFVGSAIYFLPSMYVMAVKAARNKQVDSSDLEIDSGIRLSLLGYFLLQNVVLLPLSLVIYIPWFFFALFVTVGTQMLGPALLPAAFVIGLILMFLIYLHMNLMILGAVCVADEKPIGQSISATFKIVGSHPGLFLALLVIEAVPMSFLMFTGIGFSFFGMQYLLVRTAVFYRLTASNPKRNLAGYNFG